MDKKASCLFLVNRSDCYVFPFFALHKRAPRRGSGVAVAFFGIPFLAKQERYVAAGLPPAGNLELTKDRQQARVGTMCPRVELNFLCEFDLRSEVFVRLVGRW
jgi:hypothetical protein